MAAQADYDVVVIGAGVAGLAASVQLDDMRPKTRTLVVEKREQPVPPTAYKVGEALAETSSHYLAHDLGLFDHLQENHLRKMGLRWFMSNNGNTDLSRRIEFGLRRFSPLPTFQIDRGEIENHLATVASDRGVDVCDQTAVSAVDFGSDRHKVTLKRNGQEREVTTRWVVDATGRQAFLRGKLGVGVELPIKANAAWFRVPYRMLIDDWCDDPAWKEQVPTGTRWRSTCSFVGQGYWTWVINLGSGSTSVGVVTDPKHFSWDDTRRYEVLIEWLRRVEPQLASRLPDEESGLLDFMKRKDFSRATVRAFSRRRWALTGEAALFVDPLYSTGHDTGAVGNTLLTDLIKRNLDGEDGREFSQRVRSHNRALLGLTFGIADFFPGALSMYGEPVATASKLLWDNVAYFNVLLRLFRTRGILDVELISSLQPTFRLLKDINQFMQKELRRWGTDGKDRRAGGIPIISDYLFSQMVSPVPDQYSREDLRRDIESSVLRLHTISREINDRFAAAAGEPRAEFPYAEPPTMDEDLVTWSEYDRRTGPPDQRDPQPDDGWILR